MIYIREIPIYFPYEPYEPQKIYTDLRGKKGYPLSYDFLVYQNGQPFFLLECQGIQHFMNSRQRKCEKVIARDKIKKKLCEENGVKILYYSNLGIEYPYDVITDKNNLQKKKKKYANK